MNLVLWVAFFKALKVRLHIGWASAFPSTITKSKTSCNLHWKARVHVRSWKKSASFTVVKRVLWSPTRQLYIQYYFMQRNPSLTNHAQCHLATTPMGSKGGFSPHFKATFYLRTMGGRKFEVCLYLSWNPMIFLKNKFLCVFLFTAFLHWSQTYLYLCCNVGLLLHYTYNYLF